MAKRPRWISSEVYFPIITVLYVILWAVSLLLYSGPLTLGQGDASVQTILSEAIGVWLITVIAFNLLMATRARWVERIFGGLDKMYLVHRRAGVIAVVFLLLHFGLGPKLPGATAGKTLGIAAMVLIFIGVALAVAPVAKRRIPYNRWMPMHRLMGPIFVLGIAHAFLVPTFVSQLPLIRVYMLLVSIVGVGAWLYGVFLRPRVNPKLDYRITGVRRFGAAVVELSMDPVDASMQFVPGQFAFFGFSDINPREAHPFTISSHPDQDGLQVAVRASGDFTESLQTLAEEGQAVRVEGAYGHFTQRWNPARRQLWIAGGIGITPFLSLARDLEHSERDVTLYWTVRSEDEAIYDDVLRSLAERTPGFSYHLWLSNRDGRLTADAIPEAQDADGLGVLICGPEAMRDSLTDQLHARGVSRGSISAEEFSFR